MHSAFIQWMMEEKNQKQMLFPLEVAEQLMTHSLMLIRRHKNYSYDQNPLALAFVWWLVDINFEVRSWSIIWVKKVWEIILPFKRRRPFRCGSFYFDDFRDSFLGMCQEVQGVTHCATSGILNMYLPLTNSFAPKSPTLRHIAQLSQD